MIGIHQNIVFDEKENAYMLIKRENQWTIVARANITGKSLKNPFDEPNKYKTYRIDNISKCKPYSISDILKSVLGSMYGLALRSPKRITAPNLVSRIENAFVEV